MTMFQPKATDPKSIERKLTSEFLGRVTKLKKDPEVKRHGDLISGLYERRRWVFVCSEHVHKRFTSEVEVRKHFHSTVHATQ